ncbi:cobyrinate a,c-diamide synthase [Sphingobium sp. BYY-5]|uniref:cobyrinate a,c-diamide synthase n=1 Tax=Sphingobium sp. BYY-5 TaxID=2926400 RepID=UPI001FA7C8C7|nr:cobyrinate a,c-diamide synthase [Sphingobium sp. BYY-5]MCI4592072.1 cobyrinate a,c-diamide synthase [Sphingobium sp. BYY-5]
MSPSGILVSAPASGAGKTMVTLGLLRALSEDGVVVQPFKCGPDYIDPAFHRAACGRASFNLDSWTMDAAMIDTIAAEAGGADLALAEGAMGLFDGAVSRGSAGHGASADIARRTGWPILLILDVSGQTQSAAAVALGFSRFDPDVVLAGVILNRVASPRHERLARAGLEAAGIRVFGALPRREDLALPERHLGLVQAQEHPRLDEAIASYAALLRERVDLAAIRDAARSNALAGSAGGRLPRPPAQRMAIAQDVAFSFLYPHLLEGWRRAGAQIMPFSPLADEAPAADADLVWLPGGYPELHAGTIASADRFLTGLRRHAANRPVHGECGGYMVLGDALIDRDGTAHRMAGLLGLVTSHAQRRLHLGYRRAELLSGLSDLPAGTRLRGHEFHYSTIVEQHDPPLMRVTDADGAVIAETGSRRGAVSGTFFHMIASEE